MQRGHAVRSEHGSAVAAFVRVQLWNVIVSVLADRISTPLVKNPNSKPKQPVITCFWVDAIMERDKTLLFTTSVPYLDDQIKKEILKLRKRWSKEEQKRPNILSA